MCGIAGVVRHRRADESRVVQAMVGSLAHRGPDEDGFATFAEAGVSIGMRRLSILDAAGGHQPMQAETDRYTAVFNGEIYNFRELWPQLVARGHRFSSDHSDTEVIVHGFEEWGTDLFRRLNGMFAVAIWDDQARRLTLARDRAGEKPLYIGPLAGGGWAFGSELKALMLHPELERSVDQIALQQYLAFDFVLAPRTILQGVQKLRAGYWATIDEQGFHTKPYWRPSFDRVDRTASDVVDELDGLLAASVKARMVADVPVGLFLSGGLDSSTIGYYMTKASDRVRSFSIGFDDPRFDESSEARVIASHLGIENTVQVFTEDQVLDLVPRITELLDEPMGDQSIFPTYLLSTVAREHVTVALGGDGSDELFMGYRTYQALKAVWTLATTPIGQIMGLASPILPRRGPDRLRKAVLLARSLGKPPEDRLLAMLGSFEGDGAWVLSSTRRSAAPNAALASAHDELREFIDGVDRASDRTIAMYLRGYLQEDILVKVDRASMATSLEVRSPFLDPAIMDFALSLPDDIKLAGMRRKDPLRRLMRGRLPDSTITQPKRGFGVPMNAWLRGALKPLVDDYLSPARLAAGGDFDPSSVSQIRKRHAAGSRTAANQLWLLLQFEMWRDRWLASPTAA